MTKISFSDSCSKEPIIKIGNLYTAVDKKTNEKRCIISVKLPDGVFGFLFIDNGIIIMEDDLDDYFVIAQEVKEIIVVV